MTQARTASTGWHAVVVPDLEQTSCCLLGWSTGSELHVCHAQRQYICLDSATAVGQAASSTAGVSMLSSTWSRSIPVCST